MKKVLITILVVLLIAAAAVGGFWWYRETHIFVEDAAYAKNSELLDLRGTGISLEHYQEVHAKLPDCEILWDVPFQGKSYSNDITELTITNLTEEDMVMLEYFPNLEKIDATGCQEYLLLESLADLRPECEITYLIDLGVGKAEPETTELTLNEGEYDYAVLMENLQYLHDLEKITLPRTALTQEQLDELAAARESMTVEYTLELLGEEYEADVTELNLSAMTPEDMESVTAKLPMFTALTNVELMNGDGESSLSLTDVKALNDAAPAVTFHYSFEFYGYDLSTTDEEVHIKNKKIGDDGVADVRQVLDVMENCSRFVLEYCQISNEAMAQLRDDYRDTTKVVWRIYFGGGSTLTDAEVIRSTYDLVDDNCHDLIYCEDVRFIDFGHNEYLDTCDFVAGMPNLEFIILSGAPIKDLTPFENCKKLRILEIAFCHYVTDISPLAACESLEMLNIGATQVTDLSALDELNMTMLMASGGKVPQEERNRFAEVHPDCWATYDGNQYGSGWRYDEEDKQLDWYKEIAEVFHYPNPYNNVGWYLD